MLDFLTKHYIVLSTGSIVLSSIIVMDFLFAYLSVFDYSLIWVIEYTDVAKFSLLSVAFVSAWGTFAAGWLQDLYNILKGPSKWWIAGLVLFGIIVFGIDPWQIYIDVKADNHHGTYDVSLLLSKILLVYILYLSLAHRPQWASRNFTTIINDISQIIIAFGAFGSTFGLYVKDVQTKEHTVITKNSTFEHTRIVMLLSHHSIFLRDGSALIIPSSDIQSISTDPDKR